jgi:hypothetical protein
MGGLRKTHREKQDINTKFRSEKLNGRDHLLNYTKWESNIEIDLRGTYGLDRPFAAQGTIVSFCEQGDELSL